MYLKPYQNCHQLQFMKNQGIFPSTSNMFKASSQLELSRPTEAWRVDKEHNKANTGSLERAKAQKLDRKKSKSISGLPSSPAYGFYSNSSKLLQRDHVHEVFQSLEKAKTPTRKSQTRDAIRRPSAGSKIPPEKRPKPLLQGQILCDQQDLHKESPSKTEPKTGLSISQVPQTPLMPQRPKPHEILKKCTTMTKKAFETREASALEG